MGFKWIEETFPFNEGFMKNYNEDSDNDVEVDVHYPEELHELHNDFPFLPGKMVIGKVEKLLANLIKKEYVIRIRNLKQALNHGLVI